MFLQGKGILFDGTQSTINYIVFGLVPERKEAAMNDINVSLFLIFLILFIIKSGIYLER